MHLKHFTLAGGAMLAVPALLPAGTIQYSGVQNLTFTLPYTAGTTTADAWTVPLDGAQDTFTIRESYISDNFGELLTTIEPLNGSGFALGSSNFEGYQYLASYAYGDPIGSTTPATNALLASFKLSNNGSWTDEQPHYFGIQFATGGKTVNGWVQAQVTRGDSTLETKVIDWAYDVDGDPITAGATAVPEPSTLALMAMGAVGLAALRKRRR